MDGYDFYSRKNFGSWGPRNCASLGRGKVIESAWFLWRPPRGRTWLRQYLSLPEDVTVGRRIHGLDEGRTVREAQPSSHNQQTL